MSNFYVAWLLSYISIASFSAAIITPALPEIQKHFSLLQGEVEWMVSAFLIGYVIGQLIYGPLANRFGRIPALRTGLVINLIGLMICILGLYVHSYSLLIIGRLISALGAASGLACTFMLINEWLPIEQRKTAMAYTILSFTLGIGLAVLLGGVITQYGHWQYCFGLLSAYGLLMLYGTKVFTETLKEPQSIHFITILNGYKKAVSSLTLVTFSVVVGLCSAIGYCFSAAGPQIANGLLKLTPAEYGYWNCFNVIGMFTSGLLAKALLQKYNAHQVIAIGLSGTALGLINIFLIDLSGSSSPIWFFMSTLLMYLFGGLLFAGGSYLASNSLSDKASGAGIMSFINMLTATLSVIVMGYLSLDPLVAFLMVLSGLWFVVLVMLIYCTWPHTLI